MTSRKERLMHFATQAAMAAALAGAILGSGSKLGAAEGPGKQVEPSGPPEVKLGVSINKPEAFRGYTLLAAMGTTKTYLIDMDGKVVRTWTSEAPPALGAYLLDNGHLLRPCENREQPFGGGPGAGGR